VDEMTSKLNNHHKNMKLKAVADQGFGKGGCPIHQKGAPEGPKARAGGGSENSFSRHFRALQTV